MVNPQRFPDARLVERSPKLDIDALYRAGALSTGEISRWTCAWLTARIEASADWITINGEQRIALQRDECIGGKFTRTKFRCGCGRGCRMLHHTQARGWTCLGCSHLEYSSRHKNRWATGLGRLQSLRRRLELGHPLHRWSKRKLREAMLAHEGNIADGVHRFVERLKASYGQHQRRSRAADAASLRSRPAATLSRRRSSAR